LKKVVKPQEKGELVNYAIQMAGLREIHVCRMLNLSPSAFRYQALPDMQIEQELRQLVESLPVGDASRWSICCQQLAHPIKHVINSK
jgi:hypothetical protein